MGTRCDLNSRTDGVRLTELHTDAERAEVPVTGLGPRFGPGAERPWAARWCQSGSGVQGCTPRRRGATACMSPFTGRRRDDKAALSDGAVDIDRQVLGRDVESGRLIEERLRVDPRGWHTVLTHVVEGRILPRRHASVDRAEPSSARQLDQVGPGYGKAAGLGRCRVRGDLDGWLAQPTSHDDLVTTGQDRTHTVSAERDRAAFRVERTRATVEIHLSGPPGTGLRTERVHDRLP
jgi:hypothetical protein